MPLSISVRLNTLLLVLLVLMTGAIIAVLATRAYGGPLDPSAPPASTMKTLDEIPGSWSRSLDATNGDLGGGFKPAGCDSSRFKCVLVETQCIVQTCIPVYNTVLDEETGLVWQRVPTGAVSNESAARIACDFHSAAGRMGWRLPSIYELRSLIDATTHAVPAGSPFAAVDNGFEFWSSTTFGNPAIFSLLDIGSSNPHSADLQTPGIRAWCVRGTGGRLDGE